MFPPTATFNEFLDKYFFNMCLFQPTNAHKINQIIYSLKCVTASNFHLIPAKFLKNSPHSLSSCLCDILNKYMAKSNIRYVLKIAQYAPVPTITSPKSRDCYRPISVLPTLSKIFEKIFYSRLYSLVTSYFILYPQQFGFRTNHATELGIAALYNDTICNKDKKLITRTFNENNGQWKRCKRHFLQTFR